MRCPNARCAAEFPVPPERLGRNLYCLECGVRMTARPIGVERLVRRRQGQVAGGPGTPLTRLPLAVVVDNVRSLWNVGSIFRTADACGVAEVVLCGITGCPPRATIHKTALGAEAAVAWSYRSDPAESVRELGRRGFATVAIERSDRAVSIDDMRWPARVCLVVGNEVAGVSGSVLELADAHVSIPMLGVKDSLNVAVAFGIAAFGAARSLRVAAGPSVGAQR